MRNLLAISLLTLSVAAPAAAQPQTPGWQQTLQGLMSGNQSQDQAVREAYERGYQRGRQDEARMSSQTRRGNDRNGEGRQPYPAESQSGQPYYNR